MKLGDVIELKRGYDLPKKHRAEGAFPIVSSSGVTGTHAEYKVDPPGVVTGRYGTIGKVFFLEEPFWPLNTSLYVRDFKGNDPRWVAGLLESLDLESMVAAAAVPGVNRNHLHSMTVKRPSVEIQKTIGAALQAFDDLIENNRRRIEILEEIARLLYREWFVHFRYPGHEDAEMVDSELGPIPEEWEVVDFVELTDRLESGGTPSRKKPELWCSHDLDWFKTGELGKGFLFEAEEGISNLAANTARVFEAGTILIAIYGATIGELGVLTRRATCNQAALGIVAKDGSATQSYLYRMLDVMQPRLVGVAQGAAQQNISKKVVSSLRVLRPPISVIQTFSSLAEPMWDLERTLTQQNRVLREARDLLLPRLVSGELDVSDLNLDDVLA